jgi:quercetin dioxygenase-like cupin family protein
MSSEIPEFPKDNFSVDPRGKKVEKPWGYEILLSPEDGPYAAKLIHVNPGCRLSLQIHDEKEETQTLLRGKAVLWLEDADGTIHKVRMQRGVGYHITPGQKHRLTAAAGSHAEVFEASTREIGMTYRLEDDYRRRDQTQDDRYREQHQE